MLHEKDIKTFELSDLIGRKLSIRSYREGNCELITAKDMETGEFFVLKEIRHPVSEHHE